MSQEKGKGLISKLKKIQEQRGFISDDNLKKIAEEFGISIGEAFSAATFYSFLSTRPQGKNIIRVCRNLPCQIKNYSSILEAIQKKLGIEIGETTKDKKFSLMFTNCIGACDAAPAVMINDKMFSKLTPKKVVEILNGYK